MTIWRFPPVAIPPPTSRVLLAVPPHGVPGFHQRDARRVSAAGPTFRGGVPRAYGGVAPRWETPDGCVSQIVHLGGRIKDFGTVSFDDRNEFAEIIA
jgi:hypothetical protein